MGVYNADVNGTILGSNYHQTTQQPFGVAVEADEVVPPAKTGQLTTRTSVSVGTLTMDVGHGFTTAALIDLFWTVNGVSGARRGVILGTVATNSCPFSGGSGDDLPANLTFITAMIPHVEIVVVVGDNAVVVAAKSDRPGFIVITQADGTVILAIRIHSANEAYNWYALSGVTNPLAGVSVGKILTSHDDATASHSPQCAIAYN